MILDLSTGLQDATRYMIDHIYAKCSLMRHRSTPSIDLDDDKLENVLVRLVVSGWLQKETYLDKFFRQGEALLIRLLRLAKRAGPP